MAIKVKPIKTLPKIEPGLNYPGNEVPISNLSLSSKIFNLELSSNTPISTSKLQPLSQETFEKLIRELKEFREKNPDIEINFKEFLAQRGFLSDLENLDFNIVDFTTKIYDGGTGIGITPFHPTTLLCDIDFSNITFKNCNFGYVNLKGSKFIKVQFIDCDFTYSVLKNCYFEAVKFEKSILKDTICNTAIFVDVTLKNSDLEYATFHNVIFNKTHFQKDSLKCVSFYKATVVDSKIENSEIEDAMFFGIHKIFGLEKEPKISKPIIGFIWNSETPGYTGTKQYLFLRNNGAIILKIDACGEIDEEKLTQEIERKLILAKKGPLPIPQMLFDTSTYNHEDSEFNSIYSMIQDIGSYLDGVVLPGGNDVHPEFFGGQRDENTHPDSSYYRDLLEFSLIHVSRNKGIPFQGICKGLQIANIYFGGNMHSKVYGQKKIVQELALQVFHGSIAGIVKNSLKAFSNHAQASHVIGDDLEVIIAKEVESLSGKVSIPKAMEMKYSQAAMFILIQFHPELSTDIYSDVEKIKYPEFTNTSEKNKTICRVIIDAAKQYKIKKSVINSLQK